MKLYNILTSIFLFIGFIAFAQQSPQDSLIQYYNKYPQQAIKDGEVIYQKALHDHNNPMLIKALILKTTFTLQINQDEYAKILRELEAYIKKEKDTNVSNILHSYIAQLYTQYYNNNSYQISQRTHLTEMDPENIEEWSSNLFAEKIFQHLFASLSSPQKLQETAVRTYSPILILGSASDSLRPTLYDFLCHRAIKIFRSVYFSNSSTQTKSYSDILAEVDVFVKMPLTTNFQNTSSNILKIWQDLLTYRLQDSNPEALLFANLERLDYAKYISTAPNTDSLYLATLRQMKHKYISHPMVVEIMAKEVNALINNSFSIMPLKYQNIQLQKEKQIKQQALTICEEGIRLYPHYNRINLLHQLINQIKSPAITAEFPKTIYPGEPLCLKIQTQNVDSITIELHRIHINTEKYPSIRNNTHTLLPTTQIYKQTHILSPNLVKQDTTFFIEIPSSGFYQLKINLPKTKETISDDFIATQLYCNYQSFNKKYNFQVCDWQSGKAIKNAKILIYDYNYHKNRLIDSIFTNNQGLANYPIKQQTNIQYKVVNTENPNGYLMPVYNSWHSSKSHHYMEIITDRKIYRPGQTVFFKAITWNATVDTLYALNNKEFTVIFRDANNKELAQQKKTSNKFGSFTGYFTIPTQTLNGNFNICIGENSTDITVSSYKRPEFEITFSEPKRTYYTGDTICIKGQVNSFSGIKSAHLNIKYNITQHSFPFGSPESANTMQGIIQTNANGEFELTFKAQPILEKRPSPYSYKITVTATDSKGETQRGFTQIPIYTGIAQPILNIPQQVNKNQNTAFNISLKDVAPIDSFRTIHYSLSKLVSPSTPSAIQDTLIEKTLLQGQFQMKQQDSIVPSLHDFASGAYLFTVECDQTKAHHIFYLYSTKDKRPPMPTYNWLVKEKTMCNIGETARIQFGTSVQNAHVRYQIFSSDKLLKQNFLTLSNEIVNIDIPFEAKYGSQIWLCIHYVKDKKIIQEIIPIKQIRDNKKLSVLTKVFRDKLQPGKNEEWNIQILNTKEETVNAEILAMMYDASLDKLVPYQVDFYPSYLYPEFPYSWKDSYFFNTQNHQALYAWDFKRQKLDFPAFHFDQLNTFNHNLSKYETFSFNNFDAEYGSSDIAVNNINTRTYGIPRTTSAKMFASGINATSEAAAPAIQFRQNFQETAFFYPQLLTDSTGCANIRFTVPESLTQWKFTVLAHTPDMASGKLTRSITTSKLLMVRPNLPRFLRSGDQAELQVTVSNLSDRLQEGIARLEFFIPGNKQVLFTHTADFRINGKQNQTIHFDIKVPQNIDLVGCRISADSKDFSDGEQQLLPILPNQTLVTTSLPIYSTQSGVQSYTLENHSTTRSDYRLTLEMTANPIWYAVLALPTLTESISENIIHISAAYYVNTIATLIARSNPSVAEAIHQWKTTQDTPTLLSKLEQNSELKSILLEASPWVLQAQNETEQMQNLMQLFDINRSQYLQAQALQKLNLLQTEEGGWSWFKGMTTSRFITANVLTVLSRANTTGEQEYSEQEKIMQIKALRFLDNEIINDFKNKPKHIGYDQIIYLYVRSMYRDIPLADALTAHRYFMSLAQQQWSTFSFYEKAITATALSNYGVTAEAQNILKSLRQYSVTTPENGMYWPNNRNEYTRHSALQTHTAILEAFYQIAGNTSEIDLMKQWLLRQKQTQNWGSVPATVDAVYSLLLTGNQALAKQDQLQIEWGKQNLSTPINSNPLGYIKKSYTAGEIKPELLTVKITKTDNQPSWGGLYLQYFEKTDRIKQQGNEISVEKKLYIEQENANGKKELIPVNRQNIQIGNKVIVRLVLSLQRDMEYLHLKDLRAACFEPVQQLSGNQWKFGTVYYQEVKDAATHFFFNALNRGTYVIEYPVWVNQSGEYQDGIATFQCIYAPEYNATSEAERIKVNIR
ncbi:MAG: alpha-2-macroglobulin family protein [Odoribacter sp.]